METAVEISSASVIVCSFLWRISGKREAPALRNAPAGTAKGDIALGEKQNMKERGPYYKTECEKDLWFPLRSVQAESLHLVSIYHRDRCFSRASTSLLCRELPGDGSGSLKKPGDRRHCLAKDRTTWWSKAKNFVPFGGRNALLRTRGRPGRNRNKQEQNKTFVPNSDFCNDLCEKTSSCSCQNGTQSL